MPRLIKAAACCIVLTLGLAGCSGDGSPDGGAGGTGGGAGSADGLWGYGTGKATRFSGTPLSFVEGTFDAGGAQAWPLLDDAAEIVLQFSGTTLREHVWFHGAQVYFTTTQEVVHLGDTYEAPDTRARRVTARRGAFSRSFRLKGGGLVQTIGATGSDGTSVDQLLLETTCTRLTGGFPPPGWPTTSVPVE